MIPVAMLMTAVGMLQGRISANLMSLGALDFGLIVDGAVIITENSLRHLAERQRELRPRLSRCDERLATVRASAEEMIQPTVYGQAIIILVYVPLLTFSGRRRQDVRADGADRDPRARRGLRPVADLRAGADRHRRDGRVQESENVIVRGLKRALCAAADARDQASPLR